MAVYLSEETCPGRVSNWVLSVNPDDSVPTVIIPQCSIGGNNDFDNEECCLYTNYSVSSSEIADRRRKVVRVVSSDWPDLLGAMGFSAVLAVSTSRQLSQSREAG